MSRNLDAAKTLTPSSEERCAIAMIVRSAAAERDRANFVTLSAEASTLSVSGQTSHATMTRGFRGRPAPGRRPPQLLDFGVNLNSPSSAGKIFSARNRLPVSGARGSPLRKAPLPTY
jgi:hypothetical protein